MDLDEWEYLPDDAFLDFHEDCEDKRRMFSSKSYSDSKTSVFNMNYFIIPSPNSRKIIQTPPPPPANSKVPNHHQLVPVPIQLELPHKFIKVPEEKSPIEEKSVFVANKAEQDNLQSQVYFKKTWENEFTDMKMDSPPKSPTYAVAAAAAAAAAARIHQFDEKLGEALENKMTTSPRCKMNEKDSFLLEAEEDSKREDDLDNNNNNNNIWKLSLTGVGAICSFGFAAATICILFFGTHQKNKQYQHNQNRFQIYSDDKRMKEAVHHATKLNDAFSAARGVPLTRAHVTYGGYYNAL